MGTGRSPASLRGPVGELCGFSKPFREAASATDLSEVTAEGDGVMSYPKRWGFSAHVEGKAERSCPLARVGNSELRGKRFPLHSPAARREAGSVARTGACAAKASPRWVILSSPLGQRIRLGPRKGTCCSPCVVISPCIIVPAVYCPGFNSSLRFTLNQTINFAMSLHCFPGQLGASPRAKEQSRGVRRTLLPPAALQRDRPCTAADAVLQRPSCSWALEHRQRGGDARLG